MNELIEHFAERATKEMDQEAFSEDMNIPVEWYHKFAELIVRECLVQIGNAIPDTDCSSSGPYKTARIAATSRVKEHFGVEE